MDTTFSEQESDSNPRPSNLHRLADTYIDHTDQKMNYVNKCTLRIFSCVFLHFRAFTQFTMSIRILIDQTKISSSKIIQTNEYIEHNNFYFIVRPSEYPQIPPSPTHVPLRCSGEPLFLFRRGVTVVC